MITLNGTLLTSVKLYYPKIGAWLAHVESGEDLSDEQDKAATLKIDDVSLVGTVVSTDNTIPGKSCATVVAGAGKMSSLPPAQNFAASTSAKRVIQEFLKTTGDSLSPVASADTLAKFLDRYQVSSTEPVGEQLTKLLSQLDATWIHDDSGNVDIAKDTSTTPVKLPNDSTALYTSNTARAYQIPSLTSLPRPRQTLGGRQIKEVTVTSDAKSTTLVLSFSTLSVPASKRSDTRFLGCYPCQVVRQIDEHFFEVNPDDPSIRGQGMGYVRYRLGLPGSSLTGVSRGTRCWIAFDNADASRPFIAGFERRNDEEGNFVLTVGEPGSAQYAAMAETCNANFSAIRDFINQTAVFSTPMGPTSAGTIAGGTTMPELEDVSCTHLKVS